MQHINRCVNEAEEKQAHPNPHLATQVVLKQAKKSVVKKQPNIKYEHILFIKHKKTFMLEK